LFWGRKLFTGFSTEFPGCGEVCFFKIRAFAEKQNGHPCGWPFDFAANASSGRLRGLGGLFYPGRQIFPFEVAFPASLLFNFIGLFAHKCLYIALRLRFFVMAL